MISYAARWKQLEHASTESPAAAAANANFPNPRSFRRLIARHGSTVS